jgi:hypothetical protein
MRESQNKSFPKLLLRFLILLLLVCAIAIGVTLSKRSQDIREEASVPDGVATVSFEPLTGTYEVGDTITVSVHFNPSNIAISSVGVRLTYPFSGATPEVTVSSVDVNPSILSSGDWTCPTPDDPRLGGNSVIMDIACANIASGGFTSNTDMLLATVSLYVERPLSVNINPLTLRFDAGESKITRWRDNQDILLIPQSTGSYTVSSTGVQPTQTPTPTGIGDPGDLTATPTKVVTLTPTTIITTTGSPSPTTVETLPDAGVSFPTLMGIGAGIFILLAALVLAL